MLQPIQFYSCFISYSGKDEEFARRLVERMLGEKLRVWFAPEELRRGEKLYEQIDRATQVNDRLIVVLSKHSVGCVQRTNRFTREQYARLSVVRCTHPTLEITKARRAKGDGGRRRVFPIATAWLGRRPATAR